MLYFENWKILLIVAVCALGVLFSVPNLFRSGALDSLPSFIPHRQVSLGLDLRGGSYLLLKVDFAKAQHERLNSVVDSVREALRSADIGYTGLAVKGASIVFRLRNTGQVEKARAGLAKVDPDLVTTIGAVGGANLHYNKLASETRERQAVDQSIEIIRRRIDATGIKEPTIEREGADRIVVELPGVGNPEHVKKLIGKTARLTFQLVDPSIPVEAARAGHLPDGDEILPAASGAGGANDGGAYVVKRRVIVGGGQLVDAQPTFQGNEPIVSFRFNSEGARRFGQATAANVGKQLAIVLDKKVISAPVVREPILGGNGVITGNFTVRAANDLALLLRAGALPAPIKILEERTVGPGLGADSIRAGTLACVVAVVLVIVFMVLFYGLFGIFADIALFFNLCLMIGALTALGATLTLPGIAGIALTLGMAVDANVLIYERIREEMRSGRTLLSSLDAGFKRAFGTIVDSHVTTLVAGGLMYWLGSGPVRGFAVTLSIGVLTSLFSAILVTRLLIVTWLRRMKPKAIPL